MTRLFLVGLALTIGSAAWAAQPSPDVPCDLHPGAETQRYQAIDALPPMLVAELMRRWGGSVATPVEIAAYIAPRDADWQVTDVLFKQPLPSRRFIGAMRRGDRFEIWYESGGLAHVYHLAIFEAGGAGDYRLVAHLIGALQQLCSAAATARRGANAGSW